MPSPEIIQRLKKYLETSKTFALLPPSKQARYLTEIETAEDTQVISIMQIIEEEDKKYLEAERQLMENAQKKLELADKLSQEIKDTKLEAQKEHEEKENRQSKQILQNLEKELATPKAEKKPAERKKFLGIF